MIFIKSLILDFKVLEIITDLLMMIMWSFLDKQFLGEKLYLLGIVLKKKFLKI